MNRLRAMLLMAGLLLAAGGERLRGEVVPAAPWETLEAIEDLRMFFSLAACRVHELDSLVRYARGFGAAVETEEAREWHQEALRLFEPLKSLDDGGQNLMAWVDYRRHEVDIAEDLGYLRALLGSCAADVLAFHAALDARIAAVREVVEAAATKRGWQPPRLHPAMPWADPHREIGRRMGQTLAWFVWMNQDPEQARAALDRQQRLGVDTLLEKAAKLGIRAIVPEYPGHDNEEACSWRVVEAREGFYDFSRLDANIEALARHGLTVIVPIRSLSTRPPAWALERFGDEARLWSRDADGADATPDDGVNLLHAPTRDAFLRYLDALLNHLRARHDGQVTALLLETRATSLAAERDYSPAAQRHFREWMTRRYGGIEALNAAWRTDLAGFDALAIPPPRREPPPPAGADEAGAPPPAQGVIWHDWLAWRKAWVGEYFSLQAAVVRRALPGVPIKAYAIEANSHHAHTERPIASWPLSTFGTLADLPASCATVEPVHVLLRAAGEGRFAGHHAEQNFGSMLGGAAYASFLKDGLLSVARDGPDMILRYFYSPGLYGYMDRQFGWDAAYSYRMKVREMGRLATLIENTRPAPAELAVLWSESSFDRDPTPYSRWGVLGTAYALMCAKVHYDVLLEHQIAAGAWSRYRWLIVPEQRYLPDAVLDALRRFVEAGGTLLATSVPGLYDERGGYRGHALADLFGADLKGFTPIQAIPGTFLVPTRPDSVWGNRERGADGLKRTFHPQEWTLQGALCAAFEPRAGAEVLATFADGQAALVRNRRGAGAAVILGYPFGHEYAYSNPTEMSFGKIYPHFPYPPQMTALQNWLGAFLRETLDYPQPVEVPRSWMDRFVGHERSGPCLTYPGLGDTYTAKRLESDIPNHSLAIGLREREGVASHYLTVWNRDSAYAAGRGYLHYMASPTYAIIRLNRGDVTAIYDLINRSYVPFVRGDLSRRQRDGSYADADRCISFEATIPAYFGRVYALATGAPQVELFEERPVRGIADDTLLARVRALAEPWTPPEVLFWEREALAAWRRQQQADAAGEPIVIAYGSADYREAAERLAGALRQDGVSVRLSSLNVRQATTSHCPYLRMRGARWERLLPRIDVFIGNDYSNTNLADLSGAWQSTSHAAPVLPLSVNNHFPGGDRAVVMLTRPFSVRAPDTKRRYPEHYHQFSERPRHLVIGASSPAGALRGVRAFLALTDAATAP